MYIYISHYCCLPLSLSISQDHFPVYFSLIIIRSRSLSILNLLILCFLYLSDSLSLTYYSSLPPSRTSFSYREGSVCIFVTRLVNGFDGDKVTVPEG